MNRPGWFARLPLWGKVLFVLVWPVSTAYGLYWMWKDERYTKNVRIALTAGAAFLFLYAAISSDTVGGQEPQPALVSNTSQQTAKAPKAASPEPVAAPEPVAEPEQAAAPEPAPDPKPAPAETGPTAAEREYALEVASISTETGGALSALGDVLTQDPTSVFYDDEVKMEVVVYMATVKAGYLEAKELNPPARMKAVHEDFLGAMKLYDQSMSELANGIDNVDDKRINTALELMVKATTKMNSAASKLKALQ